MLESRESAPITRCYRLRWQRVTSALPARPVNPCPAWLIAADPYGIAGRAGGCVCGNNAGSMEVCECERR